MMSSQPKPSAAYSTLEERWNVYTHGFGFVASFVGLLLLCFRESGNLKTSISIIIFGVSACVLYLASTAYHNAKNPLYRSRLKVFDHAAIYVLIAGTYTPFTLVTLADDIGILLFCIVWAIAIAGIVLKLFFTGRFDILSTVLYVGMGWIIVFAYKPLTTLLAPAGLQWLFAGGIAYTLGAVLYSVNRIPFNHAIFHVFVLAGSFCHFMAIYFYVR